MPVGALLPGALATVLGVRGALRILTALIASIDQGKREAGTFAAREWGAANAPPLEAVSQQLPAGGGVGLCEQPSLGIFLSCPGIRRRLCTCLRSCTRCR
jgi:hypothetical protein